MSSKRSLSLRVWHENPVCTSSRLHIYIKPVVTQSCPLPCYLVPLRPKYFHQDSILKHPQAMFLPQRDRDQVSHPYKTASKSLVLYNFNLFFFSKLEYKSFCPLWYQAFRDFNLPLISSSSRCLFVRAVLKHLNCSTLTEDLLSMSMLWLSSALCSQTWSCTYT